MSHLKNGKNELVEWLALNSNPVPQKKKKKKKRRVQGPGLNP
jgi:hypothetical protein